MMKTSYRKMKPTFLMMLEGLTCSVIFGPYPKLIINKYLLHDYRTNVHIFSYFLNQNLSRK